MPKIRKKTSKRPTLRKQYSVQKKVKTHHAKIKKEAKKLSKLGITPKRMKKNPGLPNLFPHKEEMLIALERKQNMEKELLDQVKALRSAKKTLPGGTLENYAASVQAKVINYEEEKKMAGLTEGEIREATSLMAKAGEIEDPNARQMSQSRKAYYRELKKVIEASDVVIEVLDARDPEGCRNHEIEQQVIAGGKKMLLVLNKIDLVPPQNARLWQRALRREHATVLFKAGTQSQNSNLATGATLHKKSLIQNAAMVEKMTNLSTAVGTENLLNILKNYSRVAGEAKAKSLITVGVIGFPNVGKSSLINSLKRTKAAATGNTPGVTKQMQEIQLDKNIILLDSPGVVLTTSEQSDSLILRSAIRVEDLVDPIRPVEALLARIEHEQLLKFYRIAAFTSVQNFLALVARKRGFLQSGGIVNMDQSARQVIRDFLNGKLAFHTQPPIVDDEIADEDDDQEMQ